MCSSTWNTKLFSVRNLVVFIWYFSEAWFTIWRISHHSSYFYIKLHSFQVKNQLETAARNAGVSPTNEAMYEFLISRVRDNLHIVLCMSPIGEAFRNRLRQYPALINCTTIDWFTEWPREALLEVAVKYISDVNFVETITGEAHVKLSLV